MNKSNDYKKFDLLKKAVASQFLKETPVQSDDISDWKGHEIVLFQEDLFNKTKSTVSEKWFYTYFKSDFTKLPRIDMLNLLSQYCGYINWGDFLKTHYESQKIIETENSLQEKTSSGIDHSPVIEEKIKSIEQYEATNVAEKSNNFKKHNRKKKWDRIIIISSLILIFSCLGMYYFIFSTKNYTFCFIDSDQEKSIKNSIRITILREGLTPSYFSTNTGCFSFESKKEIIKLAVNSTYHKKDTFIINLNEYHSPENIALKADDYKLMLYYYSNSSKDLKLRIKKLNQMIDDDALIYQVYDNNFFGVEILSKQQYINLVSLPTTSLKNFTLIESESKKGKFIKLKFKIQQDDDNNIPK